MAAVGLVLGAGGIIGQAYHAGVLASLERDLGWDPRTADVIVGSSAGSVTGTMLRLGVPASDLASKLLASPLTEAGATVLNALGQDDIAVPALKARDVLRPWRVPTARLVGRVSRRPWAFRPGVAAATLLPAGRFDLLGAAVGLERLVGDQWPDGLWLCAARRDDGGRVVFGRPGSPRASLVRAVAASCAIPAWFAPVDIGGVTYFDGGVHSPTSADVLRTAHLDVVVVVSPMSSARHLPTVDGALRWSAHRRLMGEVRRLAEAGTTVVRFEPGRRAVAVMGPNAMVDDRSDRVVRQAMHDARRLAARPAISAKLAPLRDRPATT